MTVAESKGMTGYTVSHKELELGAKSLVHTEIKTAAAGGGHRQNKEESDIEELEAVYVSLYEKHDGDLKAIMLALHENPGKALKYPPQDAEDFAAKYVKGYYTYTPQKEAVAERKREAK